MLKTILRTEPGVYKDDLTGDCQLVSKMPRKAQKKSTRQDPKKRAAEDTRAASDDEVIRRCTHLQRASTACTRQRGNRTEIVRCKHVQITYHLRNVRCTQPLTARRVVQTTRELVAEGTATEGVLAFSARATNSRPQDSSLCYPACFAQNAFSAPGHKYTLMLPHCVALGTPPRAQINKDSPTVLRCLYLIKRAWNKPNSSNSGGGNAEDVSFMVSVLRGRISVTVGGSEKPDCLVSSHLRVHGEIQLSLMVLINGTCVYPLVMRVLPASRALGEK
ncbi:hypothetical protein Bbelb_436480 [Branchiostoma belcheri]|nr:hypothetical protein Bbelb_436480 [Branchiostoma belcheri]